MIDSKSMNLIFMDGMLIDYNTLLIDFHNQLWHLLDLDDVKELREFILKTFNDIENNERYEFKLEKDEIVICDLIDGKPISKNMWKDVSYDIKVNNLTYDMWSKLRKNYKNIFHYVTPTVKSKFFNNINEGFDLFIVEDNSLFPEFFINFKNNIDTNKVIPVEKLHLKIESILKSNPIGELSITVFSGSVANVYISIEDIINKLDKSVLERFMLSSIVCKYNKSNKDLINKILEESNESHPTFGLIRSFSLTRI